MTLSDVLCELLHCLGIEDGYIVSWEQMQRWPPEAIDIFLKIGWLKPTFPAATIECHGCEHNCFMPVQYHAIPIGKLSMAFVGCDVRYEMGKIDIPLKRLQQWQLTYSQLAQWVLRKLNIKGNPEPNDEKASFKLGAIKGTLRTAELHLDFSHPVLLRTSGHALPLIEIININKLQVRLDKSAIFALIDLPPAAKRKAKTTTIKKKSTIDQIGKIGSPEWREKNARDAANARHSRPGGSHDKKKKMRDKWASCKYTSRDICAEQECAGLGMSFSAARKALINTPDPT